MLAWMLVLLCGRGLPSEADVRHVDMIEVSHVADWAGCITFTQVILWKVHPEDGRYHTWGWRMMHPHEWPMRHGGRWVVVGVHPGIRIEAPAMRESWSNIDPESADRRAFRKSEQPPNLFEVRKKPERVEE